MSAPARLLALRLQGFKSFGERTLIEFGPGISAVVGPNGSGKSNLADALRWALGEQGRALRLRRSEDVVFAGSERRSALGMADVTIVLDNADRLLPVDYATLELGRRLYRSGENDYLLNRQRIRLRDLLDLLDAARLADNAFLFIGQGMVDQALALRPEERRPLFEEVAGVRRHERRKRRAEEQLLEAEANLARVEDVLGELRPQARRLAAQAEQQASRQTAGREYGRAVLAAARARWRLTSAAAAAATARLSAGRGELDRALASLRQAEAAAAELARDVADRSAAEADRRTAHEAARTAFTDLQLQAARVAGETAAAQRDRQRLRAELAALEADLEARRQTAAAPVPTRDLALAASLAEVDRDLGEALQELAALRAARQARGEALAALRRAATARAGELEAARRRLAEATRAATEERAAAEDVRRRSEEAEVRAAARRTDLAAAIEAERASAAARESARLALDEREGARQVAAERSSSLASRSAGLRGRLEALRSRLEEEESRGIARAARRAGGRLLDEGLQVDPSLRTAVEAVLGEATRAYLVDRQAAAGLAGERGALLVEAATAAAGAAGDPSRAAQPRPAPARDATLFEAAVAAAAAAGGGRLADAIRLDPGGGALRLVAGAVWVPDLEAALAIQPALPPGAVVATRDGAVLAASGLLTLGRAESRLERRAAVERLEEESATADHEAEVAATDAAALAGAAAAARAELGAARDAERVAAAARRTAEDEERRAAREADSVAREAAWHAAQAVRLEADRERAAAAMAAPGAAAAGGGPAGGGPAGGGPVEVRVGENGSGAEGSGDEGPGDGGPVDEGPGDEAAAVGEWEARAAGLRARRDQLAAEDGRLEAARAAAEARRATAAAAVTLGEERLGRLDREAVELAAREERLAAERERLGEAVAAAAAREAETRAELDALRAAEASARGRLAEAADATDRAREALRSAQERNRAAEVAELEARLSLDAVREQVLVELAGLGDLGLRLLADEAGADPLEAARGAPAVAAAGDRAAAGDPASPTGAEAGSGPASDSGESGSAADALEPLLSLAAARWAAGPPSDPPSPARLGALRRRYNDLGGANPFATEEYEAVRARLDGLEAQRSDLTAAIVKTRTLIEQLNSMISDQFRTTFLALEAAFDGRFRQLFGGGFARLSLTEPDDLAATGVEIVARPPGKKAQPLSMLSGGERALTAVALLFSMLEVRPVPFCVLDEVDAALDEANVGRFTEALRGLADQTQFIVITHNRGTIETADALYGVTIGEDAVSRVISLRLEEARELAERSGRREAVGPAG